LELPLLLSLGALVSESLSTRRDSVLAPDRLCVDEDRLEPEERLRELERERDDWLFDFFEELPPERLLLFDWDFCWGILPSLLLVTPSEASTRDLRFTRALQFKPSPNG
jgi:hypothetical protein